MPNKVTWVAIQGFVEQNDGRMIYQPDAVAGPSHVSIAVLGSDAEFQEGAVKFQLDASAGVARNGHVPEQLSPPLFDQPDEPSCRLELSARERPVYVGVNVVPGSLYGITAWSGTRWETVAATGNRHEFPVGRPLRLEVRVAGSFVELLAEGVPVCVGNAIIRRSPLRLWFHGNQQLTVSRVEIESQKPKVFVVMQFTEEFNDLYREVIKPTCEAFGCEAVRADDMYTSGLIIGDILTSIHEASVIVADVTPDNPNVYYEVGYAHGVGKPTILLSEKRRATKLPFDLAGVRTIFDDNTIGGKGQVETRLHKHLENIVGRQIAPVA